MATAKKSGLEPIANNTEFAAASALLQTLQTGLQALEQEQRALEIERSLPSAPPKAARAMRERLQAHRQKFPAIEPTVPAGIPRAVHLALQVIEGGDLQVVQTRRARENLDALIAQLGVDAATVRNGITAQTQVVDEIRDRLSHETATRVRSEHRSLVLSQYRALQALSAATMAEQDFHRAVTAAGYVWRADILSAPALRAALCAGAESDHDSEVSRTRRMLEELKLL